MPNDAPSQPRAAGSMPDTGMSRGAAGMGGGGEGRGQGVALALDDIGEFSDG
jgi:hypothetical protein